MWQTICVVVLQLIMFTRPIDIKIKKKNIAEIVLNKILFYKLLLFFEIYDIICGFFLLLSFYWFCVANKRNIKLCTFYVV